MEGHLLFIKNTIAQLEHRIQSAPITEELKVCAKQKVGCVDLSLLEYLCVHASRQLTSINLSYIICFLANLDTDVIAAVFAIEPATVYSVRYRLRSRFEKGAFFPF